MFGFRFHWPIVLVIAVAHAISLGLAFRRTQRGGPAIWIPNCPTHLGHGKPNEVVHGEFDIHNAGGSALTFKIDPSCGCSTLHPTEGTVPSGKTMTVRIGVRVGTVAGADRSVQLRIASNDARNPSVVYNLVASCSDVFRIEPRSVLFGRVPEGQSRAIGLRIRDGRRGVLASAKNVKWTSTSPHIHVRRDHESIDELRLNVTLRADTRIGPIRASLVLKRNDGQTLELPIRANVVGPLSCAPATLFLGPSDGAAGRQQGRFLVWLTNGGQLPAIRRIVKPDWMNIQQLSSSAKGRRVIFSVGVDNNTPTPSREGVLKVFFVGYVQPIAVTVRVPSQPGAARARPASPNPSSPEFK